MRTTRTATSSLTTPRRGATSPPRCAQPLLLLFRSTPHTEGGGGERRPLAILTHRRTPTTLASMAFTSATASMSPMHRQLPALKVSAVLVLPKTDRSSTATPVPAPEEAEVGSGRGPGACSEALPGPSAPGRSTRPRPSRRRRRRLSCSKRHRAAGSRALPRRRRPWAP